MSRIHDPRRPSDCLLAVIVLGALALNGCGMLPYYTRANSEYDGVPPSTRGTTTLTPDELPSGAVFVGIALSGGGSRAANFSAAALLELEALGLLDRATALSSVSGSSLTTAYYGLYGSGRDPRRWTPERLKTLLGKNLESRWIARWFLPHNIARYWLTQFDRTDIMKDVLDSVLFEGKTFTALGLGLPKILINATRLSVGQRLVFTDDTFHALRSRLDTYPISHAVMASGAFPGAFQNVTLEDFSRQRPGAPRRRSRFEHLFDGGPSDNLGVMTLLEMVRPLYRDRHRRPRACFLVIVDAYIDNPEKDVRRRDARSGIDFIVDTNVVDASDALLSLRRRDILEQAGFRDTDIGQQPVQEFPVLGPDSEEPGLRCQTWHLTFQRLLAWRRPEARNPYEQFERKPIQRKALADEVKYATAVGAVVNQISTRYKLTGPAGCSSQALQEDLYEAARLLVREDRESLNAVCDWFDNQGVGLSGCAAARRAPVENRAPSCSRETGATLHLLEPLAGEAD